LYLLNHDKTPFVNSMF